MRDIFFIFQNYICCFSLLCGSPAFYASNGEAELRTKILNGLYSSTHPGLAAVSPQALDLIEKLLTVDPTYRLSAEGALCHPWLCDPDVIMQASALGSFALVPGNLID